MAGADVFLGCFRRQDPRGLIATMARKGSCSRCPTRTPRSTPRSAAKYAAIVATGRSDFPNQINNVLAFPGVFRGALDAGARRITEEMKLAAAEAIFAVAGETWRPTDRAQPVRPACRARGCRGGSRRRRARLTVMCRPARRLTLPAWPSGSPVCSGAGNVTTTHLVAGHTGRRSRRCWPPSTSAALRTYGARARRRAPNPMAELDTAAFVVAPAFTGRLLTKRGARRNSAGRRCRSTRDDPALPEGVAAGDYTEAAEDRPALVVTEATANAWGGCDLTGSPGHCDTLNLGVASVPRAHRGRRLPATRCTEIPD